MAYALWLKYFNTFAEMNTARRKTIRVIELLIASLLLSSCLSNVWTGVSLLYDRHNGYKKIDDFQLSANINRALYHDAHFKREDCSLEVAVLNGDVLLVGYVPNQILQKEVQNRAETTHGIRRLFNQIKISHSADDVLNDGWITAKIRSQIIADASIDPHAFKVVTSGQIVYLMGDVLTEQAEKVVFYARNCAGVKRVVTLLNYYHLSEAPIKQEHPRLY